MTEPTLRDIRAALERIKPYAHRTPVLTCSTIDSLADARLYFKCENFQKVGAFKFRGACNAVFSLSESEASRGVATHSSGNHAQALALAARLRGIPAYIVMPENAPSVKRSAVEGYGGIVTLCKPNLASREETLAKVAAATGAEVVHPFNDYRVIAGQGTAALELLEEIPDLDAVIAPVGGGGLLSGTAICATELRPGIQVLAGEPHAADDAFRSIQAGRILPSDDPQTMADGLRTSLGELTFSIIRRLVEHIITVEEEEILQAMRLLWERAKIVVEPSGAVPLAAVLSRSAEVTGKRVGVILSGGNVDLGALPFR